MNLRLTAFILLLFILSSCASKQAVKLEEPAVMLPEVEDLRLPDITTQKTDVQEQKKVDTAFAEKKEEEQYVMLNFENADIDTVISTISDMLKINYILMPGLSGKVTIQSHNKVPLSELFSIFQTMLEFNGLTAVKDGSLYRIVTIETAKQQPVPVEAGKIAKSSKDSGFVTQGIPLEYVKANDIATLARNLMPRGADIAVYEPSNMLIITASPAGITKFIKLIEVIDIPSKERNVIKTFVYNVENGEAKNLAGILKSIYVTKKIGTSVVSAPAPMQAPVPQNLPRPKTPAAGAVVQEGLPGEIEGEIIIEAYDDINALVIKTTPLGYLSLLETIKKLDIQPKQVLIEVLIAEISLDDTTKFGVEWILKGHPDKFGVTGGFNASNVGLSTTDTTGTVTQAFPSGAFAYIVDPMSFKVLISAAASSGKVNVLASPHILALDNKEAKIEIGDEVPVATSIVQSTPVTSGSAVGPTTSQVQFKSVGTILTVTPHINEKKQVTLKITQEVSEIGDTVKIGSEDFTGFKTRKANTTAIVQDGHTLVLGGIITENSQKIRSGLPFLSKIPILGYLFGSTTDVHKRKELILMVTPHVVGSYEEADEITREFQNKVADVKKKIEDINKKKRSKVENNEDEAK